MDIITRLPQPSVMSGGDEVGVELSAIRPELAELEPGVADDAGIGRSTAEILVGEVVDDAVEIVLEIEGIKGDVELIGHTASVAGIDGAAATLLVIGAVIVRTRMDAGA